MHSTRTLMSLAATVALASVGYADQNLTTNAMETASHGYVIKGLEDGSSVYVFTNTAEQINWPIPSGVASIRYLVVGGGGGGGPAAGGGGGGGAFKTASEVSVAAATSCSIQVGAGGASKTCVDTKTAEDGNPGSPSVLTFGDTKVTSNGGGGGGGFQKPGSAADAGASCGGQGGRCGQSRIEPVADADGTIGCAGGTVANKTADKAGAGGGGAGSEGASGAGTNYGQKGGNGLSSDITGETICYSAGGGGGTNAKGRGTGGSLGGSDGAGGRGGDQTLVAESGMTFGSGGGGGGWGTGDASTIYFGAAGANGVVIIRCAKPSGQQENEWVELPALGKTIFVTGEGTTIALGKAKSGGLVKATYTEDGLKALSKGAYTITFSVDETEAWSSLETNIDFVVRSMAFPQPGDPDAVETTYTWNGGEGYWCDLNNWTADVTPCFGYPHSTEFASAVIASEATVVADPDGDLFGPELVKDLSISAATTLTGGVFTVSGKLKATAAVRIVDSTVSLADADAVFSGNAVFSDSTLSSGKAMLYAHGNETTYVEEGPASANAVQTVRVGFYDKTRSTNCLYVVKNGADFRPRGIIVGSNGSKDVRFVIDNTAIDISAAAGDDVKVGEDAVDSFFELKGADAGLSVTKGTLTVGTEDGTVQTSGLYFHLPTQPYASAPVVKKAGAGSGSMKLYGNAVIKLDITDAQGKGVYPLVQDARDSFKNIMEAAGGQDAYVAMLHSNLKVVRVKDGDEREVDKSLVTLSIEDGVLYATVERRGGLLLLIR